MLEADPNTHTLSPPPEDIDVEVREIWQPWLKPKCDFVVRYIVPNRVNICRIMEVKRRFSAEVGIKLLYMLPIDTSCFLFIIG
ncbi:hypothetical protein EON65_23305 [archaeon]|nr:MAG: hypothetical protein EON65_23305 [archaeon]